MSNLGYTVKKLDSVVDSEIAAGMRLARIIRKGSAKNSNGLPSQGVAVPALDVVDDFFADSVIHSYIVNCLQDVQDKMIRAIADGGRNIITDEDLDVVAMRTFLEATDDSIGRISKDKIAAWFDGEVADTLMVAFADRLGVSDEPTPDQEKKLAQVLNGYKDCFASLAAKNPSVDPKVGANLLKALDMIPASAFSVRISGIVEKAMKQPEIDLLAL